MVIVIGLLANRCRAADMAIMPRVTWIGPQGTPGGHIEPDTALYHSDTARGNQPVPVAPTEFHFWIAYDGTIVQFNDTNRECDGAFEANPHAVHIETASNVLASDLWTPPQLASMKKISFYLQSQHKITLNRCKTPTSGGQGYHCMWGIPGVWNHSGHTCPGANRIQQFNNIFLPSLLQSEVDMNLFQNALAVDSKGYVWQIVLNCPNLGKYHVPNPKLLTKIIGLDTFVGRCTLTSQTIAQLDDDYLSMFKEIGPGVTDNSVTMTPEQISQIAKQVAELATFTPAEIQQLVKAFGYALTN